MKNFHSVATALMLAASLLVAPAVAQEPPAQGIVITPIRVFIQPGETAELTIRNDTGDLVNMQVKGSAWNETIDGHEELSASSDLVFYPTIFAIPAGGTQLVRIGIASGATPPVERAFRLLIVTLPKSLVPGEMRPAITISENYSVPVFLEPSNPASNLKAIDADVSRGRLSVLLQNEGSAYDLVKGVTVTASDASGRESFHATTGGWYVLAGGQRRFEFPLHSASCSSIHTLHVVVTSENGHIDDHLPVRDLCP